MKLSTKHLLTGEEVNATEIMHLLDSAVKLKHNRLAYFNALSHRHLALLFDKHSLRTRISFAVAMRELGGDVVESINTTRKIEDPEDQMHVLQGYCHAVMVRTYEDKILERMQSVATIPIINGLSNLYHPCQTLADLMTLKEQFGILKDLTISYIGDGNNILHSLLLMAPKLGVHVHYCCPDPYQPNKDIVYKAQQQTQPGSITSHNNPTKAVKNCAAVYTDVWTSMGFEEKDETAFAGFQINETLMQHANPDAVFMHCMPMNRGYEISATLPEQPYSVIYQQSENRLHVQKALLHTLLAGD
jgi:ornithine carbamoyltransferase